jgi:hypothetical protein
LVAAQLNRHFETLDVIAAEFASVDVVLFI